MSSRCRLAMFVLWLFCAHAVVLTQNCPELSETQKERLTKYGRWLVNKPVQQEIARRSHAFGHLIDFEQCHILQSNLLSDEGVVVTGPFFLADDVSLKSLVGHQDRRWMMAVAPAQSTGKMPDPNLLEIDDGKWTLFYRDGSGQIHAVASGKY